MEPLIQILKVFPPIPGDIIDDEIFRLLFASKTQWITKFNSVMVELLTLNEVPNVWKHVLIEPQRSYPSCVARWIPLWRTLTIWSLPPEIRKLEPESYESVVYATQRNNARIIQKNILNHAHRKFLKLEKRTLLIDLRYVHLSVLFDSGLYGRPFVPPQRRVPIAN